MSVVQITKLCTLKCTYCFDRVHQSEAKKRKNIAMSRETFSAYIKRMNEFFHGTGEEKSICVSGGEPTLHEDFIPMMNEAVASGFKIYLLTNLTFNEKIQKYIKSLVEKGSLSMMTNINSPNETYAGMTNNFWERTLKNLEALESKEIRISLNVFDPDVDYDFIFEIFEKYPNIDETVRVGIENMILPAIRKSGEYVFEGETWERYKKLGKKIDEIVKKFHKIGRKVYLDCGAGWCIFKPETIENIKKNGGCLHKCNLPNDEIAIQGNYSACYAIHEFGNEDRKIKVHDTGIKRERTHFILKTEFFKTHYLILPKCQKCPLLEKGCPRFCVSNNIFYWEKAFSELEVLNGELKVGYRDGFLDKFSQQELHYSAIEYLISKGEFDKARRVLEISEKDYRIKLYEIILDFLTGDEEKKICFENFENLMNGLTEKGIKLNKKDFSLARFTDYFLKNYRKVN